MKTGVGQDASKVWGLKPLSKVYGSGFAEIRSGNRRSCSQSCTYWPNQVVPHQGRSTHETAPPLKGTPPYSSFEGDPTDKSRASPPVARWERALKTSSSRTRYFSQSSSSVTTRTTRFILKSPLRCILRVQGCHHASCVMVWWEGSHQGVIHLHFCKKGVKLVSECIKRTCYKELWNSLTWSSSVVRNGSSSRNQFLPKIQDDSGGKFRPLSAPRIGPRGVQISTPGTINCGLFWRTCLAKNVTTTWTVWRDPSWKQRQRSPWRWCVPR